MDKYYAYTTTVDFLGFGHRTRWSCRWRSSSSPRSSCWPGPRTTGGCARGRRVLVPDGRGACPCPVAIITAGAVEPQAFALAYGLGFAFLVDAVIARARE